MIEKMEVYREVAAALNFMLRVERDYDSQLRRAIKILTQHGIGPISPEEAKYLLETTSPQYLDKWILTPVPDGPSRVDRMLLLECSVKLVRFDGAISPLRLATLDRLASRIGLSTDDVMLILASFERAEMAPDAGGVGGDARNTSERESYLSYLRMLCSIFGKLLDEYSFDSDERWHLAQMLSAGDDAEVDAPTVLWLLNNLTDDHFPPKVWLQTVDEPSRVAFLTVAVDVARLDGRVTRRERLVLADLSERLLLPPYFADRILEHRALTSCSSEPHTGG